MAWITTDTDVACTLTVNKIISGQQVIGYPRTYSILDAFDTYEAITTNQWQKLSSVQRDARIDDFKSYVNNVESIDTDAIQTNTATRPTSGNVGEITEI